MKGLITKSTGSAYMVLTDEGETIEAHVKGNFRIRGIRSTNPVAVGDRVTIVRQADGTNWITDIDDRRNYVVRRSTNLSKESHILAANLDQVALLVTVNHPRTSLTFIDRFLATCEAYRVPAVLVFNKVDLLTPEEQATLQEWRTLYESLGYPTYAISAKHLTTLNTEGPERAALNGEAPKRSSAALNALFEGRTTLLSGNSGVGKSTLLNALFGRELTRTGAISDAHNKGTHTTTFSEMYFLDARSAIIDTPGIKGFGTIAMDKYEVGHYFREIFRVSQDCRFSNCTHTNEPGCAVQDAAVSGEIALSRFESYMSLLGDCDEGKYR